MVRSFSRRDSEWPFAHCIGGESSFERESCASQGTTPPPNDTLANLRSSNHIMISEGIGVNTEGCTTGTGTIPQEIPREQGNGTHSQRFRFVELEEKSKDASPPSNRSLTGYRR